MTLQLPTVPKPKGRMTEAEARRVGAAANRILNLRGLISDCAGAGTLTIRQRSGNVSLSLSAQDAEAILALMIEREAAFLIAFDIDLEDHK